MKDTFQNNKYLTIYGKKWLVLIKVSKNLAGLWLNKLINLNKLAKILSKLENRR